MTEFVPEREENNVGKTENTGYTRNGQTDDWGHYIIQDPLGVIKKMLVTNILFISQAESVIEQETSC